MGNGVGVAAGEKIHRASDEFIGMYNSLPRHAVGDQGADSKLAVRRDELHPGPALKTSFCGKFRGNLKERVRDFLADTRGALGHVAFVKMLEHASVVKMQVELLIGRVRGT